MIHVIVRDKHISGKCAVRLGLEKKAWTISLSFFLAKRSFECQTSMTASLDMKLNAAH